MTIELFVPQWALVAFTVWAAISTGLTIWKLILKRALWKLRKEQSHD